MQKTGAQSEQVIYDNLAKGINTFTRDTMINEQEAAEATNVWAVGKNSIKKRPGTVLLCNISGVGKIDGMGTYYDGSTRHLLAMAGGSLYRIDTGTPTLISAGWTSGLRTDFCQAGGKVFISNGTDALKYYNGSTITVQTNGIIGKYSIFYKSCLWIAGNPSAGNATRLYRSGSDANLGDFTNSVGNPLATSVYVSKDDGSNLNGFFKHQDYLYPVKERSLWRASQASDASGTITLEMVDPARGCDSHFSIDTVENDNFMFNENGVYATGYEPNILDQIRTNILSLRIDQKIKTIQKNKLTDVVGIYHDNHYYMAFASGGSSSNDTVMVYDRQRLGWWEWDLSANCFSIYKDSTGNTKLYFGSSTNGDIYYFDETIQSDNGNAIQTNWRSAKFSFKDYSQEKFFMNTLIYFGKTPGIVTYSVYVDSVLKRTGTVRIGNAGTAGIGIGKIGTENIGVGSGSLQISDTGSGDFLRIPINTLGRNIQVQVSDATTNRSWEVNAIINQFKKLNTLYQPGTLN